VGWPMNYRRAFCLLAVVFVANLEALTPQVTINVYNRAKLQENILRKAQEEATRILRRAGVDAEWISCKGLTREQVATASCLLPMSQTHLSLSIVSYQQDAKPSVLGVGLSG
jgi:hypothetical protein